MTCSPGKVALYTGDTLQGIAHTIVARLEQEGIRALNPAVGFPMEMEREKYWVISHKPVAVAAGLGKMGIHRTAPTIKRPIAWRCVQQVKM